ncbi:anti-phage deoxyguanosine triphosphatase [Idiomarina baltica]|uniref:Deoxyguanosinetriphosphate triphosphohydrolase-like protein n=1 Tax=Idiomarina baltica OS145 TaxID=314276 RepID=A0ABP2CQK5_9GAMM|nr:anti-phage deoxyguanosine triphosphatase [Idiomarina baltica]EAQ32050.1 deoxyguanosinetriphosphate triphosphohydrolase-like protein [Idiomarina baltica OS145]
MHSSTWLARQAEAPSRQGDTRSPFQRDKARILHSAAFRRLQAKTQVMYIGMHDFPRTRLTHSLEASQIGSSLVAHLHQQQPDISRSLGLSKSLIESLCLAHDIGHPPFGHGGEIALNYMMRRHGGFEGNGQTFRIVTQIEAYTPDAGMNLCRRTLLGLLKYPVLMSAARRAILPDDVTHFRHLPTRQWLPAKALYDDDSAALDWLLEPLSASDREHLGQFSEMPTTDRHGRSAFKSVDASIMEIADDIAYGVHDLEDAIVVGLINRELWLEQMFPKLQELASALVDFDAVELTDNLFSSHHYQRKAAIGSLVNRILTSTQLVCQSEQFESDLLSYKAQLAKTEQQLLNALKHFIFTFVIRKPEMQVQEFKGQQIVMELFDALSVEPDRLLPENTATRYKAAKQQGWNSARVISDYLSGMTDAYAARLHQELFSVQPPRI